MVKPRRPKESARLRLAGNLRVTRKALGISQEKLADLAGLHRTYVGSVERQSCFPPMRWASTRRYRQRYSMCGL